jgi:hypothetical protein
MSLEIGETPLSVVEEPLLPVRMLNEFTYCPRLAYLEWVQGEFADSVDTVEGRFHHRRWISLRSERRRLIRVATMKTR